MSITKILVVEDDPNLGYILQEALELEGYRVTRCEDGEAGLASCQRHDFDLCLIDVMLPKKDGFSLAKDIRSFNSDIPIIFLTAKSLREDRIQGFKIGGDDYLTKPFSMEELILRIQAVLKRSQAHQATENSQKKFTLGRFDFDYERSQLQFENQIQKLTHKESELLRLLCLHQNQILEREFALQHIWGADSFFTARSMDVYISKLRKYLSGDANLEIVNVFGKGYRLNIR